MCVKKCVCVCVLLCVLSLPPWFHRQKRASRRKSSPDTKEEGGSSKDADHPLGASRDYILFSPTRLAAAMKKAKLQQSLQNQSASVLTVPTGLELSTISDSLPQPGEFIHSHKTFTLFLCVVVPHMFTPCMNLYLMPILPDLY